MGSVPKLSHLQASVANPTLLYAAYELSVPDQDLHLRCFCSATFLERIEALGKHMNGFIVSDIERIWRRRQTLVQGSSWERVHFLQVHKLSELCPCF